MLGCNHNHLMYTKIYHCTIWIWFNVVNKFIYIDFYKVAYVEEGKLFIKNYTNIIIHTFKENKSNTK